MAEQKDEGSHIACLKSCRGKEMKPED